VTQVTLALLDRMPATHTAGVRSGEARDWEIGKPGENRGKIVAHWELDPAADFHDRENRCYLRPASGLPMWIQCFRPSATGRMEFSARLVLSSDSGYSKKRGSFFQSVSAYWRALPSALEGTAIDYATSILLRISSRRGLAVS
jgi:hypothetical protein